MSIEWQRLLDTAVVGLSAQAIGGLGVDHPHDPADLVRCVAYCERRGMTVERMANRSTAWARLVPEWDRLVALLKHEVETRTDGKAPETYREMRKVIAGGSDCGDCGHTGRADECPKCHGTGRRCGGRCSACYGVGGTPCRTCHGRTYVGGDR